MPASWSAAPASSGDSSGSSWRAVTFFWRPIVLCPWRVKRVTRKSRVETLADFLVEADFRSGAFSAAPLRSNAGSGPRPASVLQTAAVPPSNSLVFRRCCGRCFAGPGSVDLLLVCAGLWASEAYQEEMYTLRSPGPRLHIPPSDKTASRPSLLAPPIDGQGSADVPKSAIRTRRLTTSLSDTPSGGRSPCLAALPVRQQSEGQQRPPPSPSQRLLAVPTCSGAARASRASLRNHELHDASLTRPAPR